MKRRVCIALVYLLAWMIGGFFAPIHQPTEQELECWDQPELRVCR